MRAGAAGARLLVVAGGAYEFANDLVQEVLYATTPEPTRMQYHRAAADLLADRPGGGGRARRGGRASRPGRPAPGCAPASRPLRR